MLNNIYVKECIIFKKLHFYTVNEQKKYIVKTSTNGYSF